MTYIETNVTKTGILQNKKYLFKQLIKEILKTGTTVRLLPVEVRYYHFNLYVFKL